MTLFEDVKTWLIHTKSVQKVMKMFCITFLLGFDAKKSLKMFYLVNHKCLNFQIKFLIMVHSAQSIR